MIQPWQIDVDNHVRTQTYFGFATSNCLAWVFLSKIVKIRAISHNIAKASTYPSAECSHPLGTFRSYHKLIKIRLQIFTQCCELARLEIKRQSQRNAHARGSAAREDDCRTSSCATRQIRRKSIVSQTQSIRWDICLIYIRTGMCIYPRQFIVKVWWIDHLNRVHAASLPVTHNLF